MTPIGSCRRRSGVASASRGGGGYPAPPVLEKVRLTVVTSIKVVRNKKKTEQWKSKALKAATLMYQTEQQKKAVDGENCVNHMSADKVKAAIKKRFSGTAGPSARWLVCRQFREEARGIFHRRHSNLSVLELRVTYQSIGSIGIAETTSGRKILRSFESNPNPPPRDLWTAENEERLQSLKEMEISLEDTAVGRKKIVLEQQLNAAMLSMSPTKWNELLEVRKRKWGEEGVVGATDEVMVGAEGV